jgi:flagellar motor component MotA
LVIEVVTAIVSGLSLAILSKIRAALIITTTNKFAVLIRHHSFVCDSMLNYCKHYDY